MKNTKKIFLISAISTLLIISFLGFALANNMMYNKNANGNNNDYNYNRYYSNTPMMSYSYSSNYGYSYPRTICIDSNGNRYYLDTNGFRYYIDNNGYAYYSPAMMNDNGYNNNPVVVYMGSNGYSNDVNSDSGNSLNDYSMMRNTYYDSGMYNYNNGNHNVIYMKNHNDW